MLRTTIAFWSLTGVAMAQVPVGSEFQVNTQTYLTQRASGRAVSVAPSGDFVVAWVNLLTASCGSVCEWDLRGQRYDATGARRGGEFVVAGPITTGSSVPHPRPNVGMDGAGNFVVSWWNQGGWPAQTSGVHARRYGADGTPRGAAFLVSTYPSSHPNDEQEPTVASDAAGNFVVAWMTRYGQDGDGDGIAARRYDAAGAPSGPPFTVNTYTTGNQARPSIDMDGAGNFVIVWDEWVGTRVFGRRFDPSGIPFGPEFQVNTYTTGGLINPVVAADASGNFVVAWTRAALLGGRIGRIAAQRFDAFGAPQGTEFQAHVGIGGGRWTPSIDAHAGGEFTVAWTSYGEDGDGGGIVGRRFDVTGAPQGAEFPVNAFTTSDQEDPAVAGGPGGTFVVVWNSRIQDGWDDGVFGRRFGGLQPASLAVDATALPTSNGNGVFEPGETVRMAPGWRNVTAVSQTFGGALSSPSGPVGTVPSIVDGSAAYGTVPGGASGQCSDCYAVSVPPPSFPQPMHRDALVLESIVPPALGQSHVWRLHVGGSFTDVPTANPFYRFVETLLHHAITAGCTGDAYCPGLATTREQMAVFVLVTKEGAGYVPQACGATPMFADVPVTSGFCRWVEELARRGVVAGCGGGNYCPGASVSRDQMAVFVLRTVDPALVPPACATPVFADVPASNGFCPWIEELFRRGVVTGCGGGNYCPSGSVTREQMGVFISETFGLTLYGP